jgi:hypothetical protein
MSLVSALLAWDTFDASRTPGDVIAMATWADLAGQAARHGPVAACTPSPELVQYLPTRRQ